MSRYRTKRKAKRKKLPKRRGKKKCPRCHCNSLDRQTGRCPCGYDTGKGGKGASRTFDEFAAGKAMEEYETYATFGLTLMTKAARKKRKKSDEEE